MLRQIIFSIGLAVAAQSSFAAEAGKIIFVAGEVNVAERPAALGDAVQEGDLLSTGSDGYIYVKFVDSGLFILRPQTKARVASYHIDSANPTNTRIKLELLSGVARSQSGHAVKLARQNFRFNTPVAAIGVRGTDFTVFTDRDTSRVAVISGAITVSGFAGACLPEGTGPCEGKASRELSAAQKGQMLQVERGQSAPKLLPGGTLAPDVLMPPRLDEPGTSGSATLTSSSEVSLDPKKNATLQVRATTLPPAVVGPGNETPIAPPVVVIPPPRTISWGRWQAVVDKPADAELSKAGADRVAMNESHVLFRSEAGSSYVTPERGNIGFAMNGGEAVVRDTVTQAKSAAKIDNGQLLVDFGKATFTTSFDATHEGGRYRMASTGAVARDGVISSVSQYEPSNNMTVNGALSGDGTAIYLFQGLMTERKVINGVATWKQQ